MTDALPNSHAATGVPLPNPALATAALAACLGAPGSELALIVDAERDQLLHMPAPGALGYAVDAITGAIYPPGAPLPAARRLYASVRIRLADAPSNGIDPVLDTIAAFAGNGWRLERTPRLEPRLDRSLAVICARPQDLAPPAPQGVDGSGVLVGVVDFGCDFAHPAFRDAAARSRLLFLWDQNAAAAGDLPGRIYERAELDAALLQPDPYAALGYWPDRNGYAPALAQASDVVHGTHVLGVAAGSDIAACPAGVAPAATLAFVHLRPGAMVSSGDPADVFDGVCAMFERAAALGMPAVVNLSLGANSGSHDGNTLFDAGLDALLLQPGRAITVAAGNERQAKLNYSGRVTAAEPAVLQWRFNTGDRTQNTLRIFSEAPGAVPLLACSLAAHGITLGTSGGEGNAQDLAGHDGVDGVLYADLATTRGPEPLQQIEIRLRPSGEDETLTVTLTTNSPTPVTFSAWIDRDDREEASQSHFGLAAPLTASTLVSTACGRRTLCVGAFVHREDTLPPAEFASEGRTRDNRCKPDVSAPGFDVLAAAAYGGRVPQGSVWRKSLTARMTGSSAAAPHATGVLALMLQAAPGLTAEAAAQHLRQTAKLHPGEAGDGWHPQLGYGRIDAAAALARLRP